MLKIFVGVFVAIFAVIGFYGVIGAFADRLFSSGDVVLSIVVSDREDVECLEERIVDHISCAVMMRSQKLFLLICEELANDPEILTLARKYGAERYVVKKID